MKITAVKPWLIRTPASYWGEFLFVEMTTDEGAQAAVEQLHEFQMNGRALVVNEARPKPAGGGFGGGGGMGRGGGGGRDGGGRREPRW